MKLQITKNKFMKIWQIVERIATQRSTVPVLAGILCIAKSDGSVSLKATDMKVSIDCKADGVEVVEPGSAVLPLKVVGELFKKIPTDSFEITVEDDKGLLLAGRNRYSFSSYDAGEFPELPSSKDAPVFAQASASELSQCFEEGSVAGNPNEEFPKYLGACYIQIKDKQLRVVSTDGRRLSLSKVLVEEEESKDVLLPLTSVKEFQRILGSVNVSDQVNILYDKSLAYFRMPDLEFSVRRVESSFPNYEKILNPNTTTTMTVDRQELISALERVDVIVRDNNRMAILTLSPAGDLEILGKAPEVGEAKELVDAIISGESIKVAFNVGYLLDGLKAFHGDQVYLTFNGQEGQMMMLRPNEDSFLYMLMPIRLKQSDAQE